MAYTLWDPNGRKILVLEPLHDMGLGGNEHIEHTDVHSQKKSTIPG